MDKNSIFVSDSFVCHNTDDYIEEVSEIFTHLNSVLPTLKDDFRSIIYEQRMNAEHSSIDHPLLQDILSVNDPRIIRAQQRIEELGDFEDDEEMFLKSVRVDINLYSLFRIANSLRSINNIDDYEYFSDDDTDMDEDSDSDEEDDDDNDDNPPKYSNLSLLNEMLIKVINNISSKKHLTQFNDMFEYFLYYNINEEHFYEKLNDYFKDHLIFVIPFKNYEELFDYFERKMVRSFLFLFSPELNEEQEIDVHIKKVKKKIKNNSNYYFNDNTYIERRENRKTKRIQKLFEDETVLIKKLISANKLLNFYNIGFKNFILKDFKMDYFNKNKYKGYKMLQKYERDLSVVEKIRKFVSSRRFKLRGNLRKIKNMKLRIRNNFLNILNNYKDSKIYKKFYKINFDVAGCNLFILNFFVDIRIGYTDSRQLLFVRILLSRLMSFVDHLNDLLNCNSFLCIYSFDYFKNIKSFRIGGQIYLKRHRNTEYKKHKILDSLGN